MIRKFKIQDLESVMKIWLNCNICAHSFIIKEYWESNYKMVKELLPKHEIYVYEFKNNVIGFVGIDNSYIAGIFINENMQSRGIGTKLINKCKMIYSNLTLSVYEKNTNALRFYKEQGFDIVSKSIDKNTNEIEIHMQWLDKN